MGLFNKKNSSSKIIEEFLYKSGYDPRGCKAEKGWYGLEFTSPKNLKVFFHPLENCIVIQFVSKEKKYNINKHFEVKTKIGTVNVDPGATNASLTYALSTENADYDTFNFILDYVITNIENIINSCRG